MLLSAFKSYSEGEIDALGGRMQTYVQSLGGRQQVTWDVSVRTCPMYLFGRYRKLARDVPQAPWTISVPTSSSSSEPQDDAPETVGHEDDQQQQNEVTPSSSSSSSQQRRKGRKSVEEIISHAVCAVLGASDCRLHACGREDIDVRCLGNGRPFALEVNNAKVLPTAALLAEVVRSVNAREGLNTQGDLELHGPMSEVLSSAIVLFVILVIYCNVGDSRIVRPVLVGGDAGEGRGEEEGLCLCCVDCGQGDCREAHPAGGPVHQRGEQRRRRGGVH